MSFRKKRVFATDIKLFTLLKYERRVQNGDRDSVGRAFKIPELCHLRPRSCLRQLCHQTAFVQLLGREVRSVTSSAAA